MSHTLQGMLQQVRVGDSATAGGVQVFGLRIEAPSALHYRTLDEAMAGQELEVTEVSEGGSVPTLKLVNRSDGRVFLMAGEHLVGAKQNRILNTSLMVEGHSEVPIPVSCVEQGRWGYRSRSFVSHGSVGHAQLREKLTRSVSASYEACAAPRSDQREVWTEVSRKLGAMGSQSRSAALEQSYDDHRGTLDGIIAALPVPEGCCGAVFVIGGKVVGMDLFDQPETLKKLWPKLVRGYALDALEHRDAATAVDRSLVDEWLKRALVLEPKPYPSPGIGEDVRLTGSDVAGAGLIVEAQPVHVQLFAEAKA